MSDIPTVAFSSSRPVLDIGRKDDLLKVDDNFAP